MDRLFSYVHISKTGGASWVTELQSLLPTSNVFPKAPQGNEHSVSFQNSLNKFDFLSYHLISLRGPRQQVFSLFTECKYDSWGIAMTKDTEFPRNGTTPEDDVRDFGIWVNHFLDASTKSKPIRTHSFGCYRAANYQTNALTSTSSNPGHKEDTKAVLKPDLTRSLQVYESMDWVALTDFFHESKCLLYHRLEPKTAQITDYLETKCRCNNNANDHDVGRQIRRRRLYYDRNKVKTTKKIDIGDFNINNNSNNNSKEQEVANKNTNSNSTNNNNGNGEEDVHVTHHDHGHRNSSSGSSMMDLPADILASVDALTRVDQALYKVALHQFLREMAWLETQLERPVLCDHVLAQWEPELAYLNVSLTSMYHDEKNQMRFLLNQ